ncbi:MAG: hypothetical protein KF810_17325 [Rhizobiaceae bacterium]|nr:hypothetical protein [Rhizobiaceae bacterium]
MSAHRYTLDDLHADLGDLQQLLGVVRAILSDMDYGSGETRNHELDQVAALNRIADELALRLVGLIDRNYKSLKGGSK